MKFILLGPPASGKGTQSKKIKKEFELPHIYPDNIIVNESKKRTKLGRKIKALMKNGDKIPEDLIADTIINHIDKNCSAGFVLDEFPGSLYQAKRLDEKYTIVAAIYLDLPDDIECGNNDHDYQPTYVEHGIVELKNVLQENTDEHELGSHSQHRCRSIFDKTELENDADHKGYDEQQRAQE